LQLGQIGLRHGDAREMRDAFDGGEIDRHGGLLDGARITRRKRFAAL
jgi:hypothetical protein